MHKVTLCGPCGNMICYQHGCIKEKMQMLGPARVSDVSFCLQVLADQPLSTESDHVRVKAKNYVDALKEQLIEMERIDDAITKARSILRRQS